MLNGKIAIVTGGTRGIGLAVVRTFLHNGAKVALFGSRETSVQRALAQLREEQPDWPVIGLWPDLTDYAAVERAVHLAEGGALLPEHFGIADLMENRRPAAPAPAQATLEAIERQAIAAALVRFGGNISQTAFALGVSRPTLYRKMSKYGLEE